ncbi:MAG TPA: hypothetical protein VNO30_15770 [Kofleriaceae bacterium]|nr:hypothetical protein [Kofleriaceae bacterium]
MLVPLLWRRSVHRHSQTPRLQRLRSLGSLGPLGPLRRAAVAAVALGGLLASSPASAEISKEECLDAHSRGQDAKEQGKISMARKLFLMCAQPGCPSLVQGDCARFVDDLGRLQPTLSFVARDSNGQDLPDTVVYIDGLPVAARLDDGKVYDVDPGKHTIRFWRGRGRQEQVLTVIVGAGEKGRTISATFTPEGASLTKPTDVSGAAAKTRPLEPGPVHPIGAKVLIGAGAALALGGAALAVVGVIRIPNNCSLGTHECAAPPGDPAFDKAKSAVTLANVGFIAAGVGVAAIAGGLVWYITGAQTPKERNTVAPWWNPGAGAAGIAISGRL